MVSTNRSMIMRRKKLFSTKNKAGDIKLTSTLTREDEKHNDMVTNLKDLLK